MTRDDYLPTIIFNFRHPSSPSNKAVCDPIHKSSDFQPLRILEVDIGQPLPDLPAVDRKTGHRYQRALSQVRLHTQLLGIVELQVNEEILTAAECARQIWSALKPVIIQHLRQDGLPVVEELEATGLPLPINGSPKCVQLRQKVLADAPFVSVIVATRDRPTSLAVCLESLLSLDYPSYEIIVVDSAPSTNVTFDLIRQTYSGTSQIRYVREEYPGLGLAHNRGLVEVKAPIVAFTDDDVVADRHWLAELVKDFRLADNVGCVTGMILPIELETPAQAWIEQFGGFSKGFTRRIFDLTDNRPKGLLYPYTTGMFGSGANMAFTTSALRDIGGFDPALGAGTAALGGDDLVAFFQIVTHGYQLIYEPSAVIHHRHHRDYAALRKQVHGYGVGLTAYLTKSLLDRPWLIFQIAPRMLGGLAYMFSPKSLKNAKKQADYPKELTLIERKGMLYGPVAYLRSLWQSRKRGKYLAGQKDITTASTPPSLSPDEVPQP